MRAYLAAILLLLFGTSFRPGEYVATVTGRSASGRTLFQAELNDGTYLGKAELTVDGQKTSFDYEDDCKVIFDPEHKVYTIYLAAKDPTGKDDRYVRFWALPESFQKLPSSHDVYGFKARLEARDPRKGKEGSTPVIELDCKMEYAL